MAALKVKSPVIKNKCTWMSIIPQFKKKKEKRGKNLSKEDNLKNFSKKVQWDTAPSGTVEGRSRSRQDACSFRKS